MTIACIAVLSPSVDRYYFNKKPQNSPLYLSTFGGADQPAVHRLQSLVHASLDVVDERVDAPDTPPDPFLGLLSIAEGVSVYGFLLNTKIKILVAIRDSDSMKEEDIKLVFDILKRGYVDTISNPFYSFGTKLGTYNRFNAAVQAALAVPSGGKA